MVPSGKREDHNGDSLRSSSVPNGAYYNILRGRDLFPSGLVVTGSGTWRAPLSDALGPGNVFFFSYSE